MKKMTLPLIFCLILSLFLGGCNTANSYQVLFVDYARATMEEKAATTDCVVRAKCTKKVLNKKTNEIDTTFDIEEVFFGDVPLGKQTFHLYPYNYSTVYIPEEGKGFPDDFKDYASPDDILFQPGETYLAFLIRRTEEGDKKGAAKVEYVLLNTVCIPYGSVSSGTLDGYPIFCYFNGFDLTDDTTVEELVAYVQFVKTRDYMNPAKDEYHADSKEWPWNPIPSFDRELQQATHIVKATCQSYTWWDLGFVYEFSVDETYVGETEETVYLRDSLSRYEFNIEGSDGVLYQPGQTYYLVLKKEYSVFEENNFIYKAVNRSLLIPADKPENALYYGKTPTEYAAEDTKKAVEEQGLFSFLETYRNENALPYVGDVPLLETDMTTVIKESPLVLKIKTANRSYSEAVWLLGRMSDCTVLSVLKGDMTEGAMLDMAFCQWWAPDAPDDERNADVSMEYIVAVKKDGDIYIPTSRSSIFPATMEEEIREILSEP